MTGTVALPTWMLALALWAALDRLLSPGVRWYFRRKTNRVIREINAAPQRGVARGTSYRRRALIDRQSLEMAA